MGSQESGTSALTGQLAALRDSVGRRGSHGTYLVWQFLLGVRAAVYYYIFLCVLGLSC